MKLLEALAANENMRSIIKAFPKTLQALVLSLFYESRPARLKLYRR